MVCKITHFSVFVLDQEEALEFYTQKLGFQLKKDNKRGEFRWLTIGLANQPELQIILIPAKEGIMFDKEAALSMRTLLKKGAFGVGVFECKNIYALYEEYSQKGINFLQAPKQMEWGLEALFEDNSGNWFSLIQKDQ